MSSGHQGSTVPSKRQLDDLLSSLNRGTGAGPGAEDEVSAQASGARRQNLIEPFGPIGQAGPSRMLFDAHVRTPEQEELEKQRATAKEGAVRIETRSPVRTAALAQTPSDQAKSKGKQRMSQDDHGYATMSFKEALPILSELLEEDAFLRELKKVRLMAETSLLHVADPRQMQTEQDTLERRLWAKQEKMKADHHQQLKTDMELSVAVHNVRLHMRGADACSARIARRPIPPEKQAVSRCSTGHASCIRG